MRVYLPASLELLRRLAGEGVVQGAFDAVAVTPGLREWYATSDPEDLEYAAMSRAADLALDDAVSGRRIVVVLDPVDEDVGVVDDPVGSIVLAAAAVARVASIHVDDDDAVPVVLAARAALAGAPPGTTPPEVEDLDDHELAWFAVQELAQAIAVVERDRRSDRAPRSPSRGTGGSGTKPLP